MAKKAHLTIFTGPPMSGKTQYSDKLKSDETHPLFMVFEGHGQPKIIQKIMDTLDGGLDVIYETTDDILDIPFALLNRVDTIEIFRRYDR